MTMPRADNRRVTAALLDIVEDDRI